VRERGVLCMFVAYIRERERDRETERVRERGVLCMFVAYIL
jgi:hypothetical protein